VSEQQARNLGRHVLPSGYVLAWIWTPEGTYWHIYRPGNLQHSLAAGTFAEAIAATHRDG
jgi:hypothetical protein